jgi:CheY-like chemotaxis protein
LNNGIKYSEPGGDVRLSARVLGNEVEIRVCDSGQGIEAESLGEVFQMFAQPHPSHRLHVGLGVGQALVRRSVELHGGSVAASSEGLGHGSEFTVRLPVGDLTSAEPLLEPDRLGKEATRRRVLVVDDNKDSAKTLGMLLDILEYDVKVVFDGESALLELDRFGPQTILLDLDMPRMNGYEVARQVRQRQDSGKTRLIAVTGWGQEGDRESAREAGFDHHLLKPVAVDVLRSILAD